jgi:hypothetical protein
MLPYGYRKGVRQPVMLPLDSTSAAIAASPGIAITDSGATSTFFKEVDGSGERVVGFAMTAVASPAADGDLSVQVDISTASVYEFPPDAGTVDYSLVGKTCDIGADGVTINIDATADDSIRIVDVDVVNNTCFVQLRDNATSI